MFSGIGGLDAGVEDAWKAAGYGARTVYQVELELDARKILMRHFPDARRFDDVTEAGLPEHLRSQLPVDLICGGFPCQDLSVAGRGAGIVHGARSGLWRYFKEIVRVQAPPLVLVENVNHGRERWLGTVLGDLEALGYAARAYRVAAGDLGAPHERARAFVLAHADRESLRKLAERLPRRRARSIRRPWQVESGRDVHPWLAAIARSWATPPQVRGVDDGVSDRMGGGLSRRARLKFLGNAVCPPVAFVVALEQIRIFEDIVGE